MKEEKELIGGRVPKEVSERIKSIGESLGWGGKQEIVARALDYYVNMVDGDIEHIPIAEEEGILLTLEDVKEKLSSGESFTATNITPFSPPILERLGEIAAEYMKGDEPDKIWATDKESYEKDEPTRIPVEDVPGEAKKRKQITAIWGARKIEEESPAFEGLIVADKELVLNPTGIEVKD